MNYFLAGYPHIFQIRLDFDTFVITGPSTNEITGTYVSVVVGNDGEQVQYSNCATDIFTVTNQQTLPNVCGTLTGDHGNELKELSCEKYTYYIFIIIV